MDLKDIFIVLLLVLIFGVFLFGSLGSFLGHVNTAVSDVADTVAGEETFTVDFLEENGQNTLYREHSDIDDSGRQSSEKSSSRDSLISTEFLSKDTASKPDESSDSDSFWNFSFVDILGPKIGSSNETYEDYQIDRETDMRDSQGNMIYLSIVSTSGGQMEPGLYEVYWSKLGVINTTKIK